MKNVARAVEDTWGGVDILVNCAGGFLDAPDIEAISDEMWAKGLDWNINTKFLITREMVPMMKRKNYCRIVKYLVGCRSQCVARRVAGLRHRQSRRGRAHRRLAIDLAPFGITANVVAPGLEHIRFRRNMLH